MPTRIIQNNCPCSKGEYCTNGLKCTELNCFLLRSPTIVNRPLGISIERFNSLRSSPVSDYKQGQLLRHLIIRGTDDSMKMNQWKRIKPF
jgi:hypothetical protein